MSEQTTSKGTHNATSLLESVGGVMPSDLRCGMTKDLFGREVVHANPSAQREGKKATATSATYGRIGLGSSESASLQRSLANKLQERLPLDGWMKSLMTWKLKRTPALRQYCQLAVSASRTSEIVSGLWPTPTCHNAKQNGYPAEYRRNTIELGSIAAMWPTPSASDNRDRGGAIEPLSAEESSFGQANRIDADCEWLDCPDGKKRAVKSGLCIVADGVPARVGRLRAYGNAIVPQVAAEFIKAYRECVE